MKLLFPDIDSHRVEELAKKMRSLDPLASHVFKLKVSEY